MFPFECDVSINQNFRIVKDFSNKADATAIFLRASDYL